MTIMGLRLIAVALSALGGGIGAVATHRQIEEGNRRRLEEDNRVRQEMINRLQMNQPKQIEAVETTEEAS